MPDADPDRPGIRVDYDDLGMRELVTEMIAEAYARLETGESIP